MSGEYLSTRGYSEHHLDEIAGALQSVIDNNDTDERDEYGELIGQRLGPVTLGRIKQTVASLQLTALRLRQVNLLLSMDNGEEQFNQDWDEMEL